MKIGLFSDTHGYLHPRLFDFFKDRDEIWHAGDIGSMELVKKMEKFKPFRAVYGNIDGHEIRAEFPENLLFNCEEVKVFITHIAGSPGRYPKRVTDILQNGGLPDIFICGHSHILKVMKDPKYGFLHINPGAAGIQGFHKMMTAVRFEIEGKKIFNLEVINLGERGKIQS